MGLFLVFFFETRLLESVYYFYKSRCWTCPSFSWIHFFKFILHYVFIGFRDNESTAEEEFFPFILRTLLKLRNKVVLCTTLILTISDAFSKMLLNFYVFLLFKNSIVKQNIESQYIITVSILFNQKLCFKTYTFSFTIAKFRLILSNSNGNSQNTSKKLVDQSY